MIKWLKKLFKKPKKIAKVITISNDYEWISVYDIDMNDYDSVLYAMLHEFYHD